MTLWINEMPSWLAFVVTIAIANGLAIAAMTVARRWSRGIGVTEGPSVVRELVLLRIRTPQESRTAVLKEAEIFGGRVVDSGVEGFAIEVTGDPEKLGEFVDVMSAYGEVDVTRSGALAIALDSKKLRLQPPVSTVGQGHALPLQK